jgi:hypothetical protein
MRTRRVTMLLLGLWLGGSLFMIFVATQNFASVERLLASPPEPVSKWISQLGHDDARFMLRYMASEQNRFYFVRWEWAQIGLGLVISGIIAVSPRIGRAALILSGLMLLVAIAETTLLTPQIVGLGRSIDFIPQTVQTPERALFWRLHHFYSGLEVFKLVLGLGLAVLLVRDRRNSLRLREVNPVDHAHHGHIDR